jgi:membrane protein required for colicin V production
MTGTFTPLDFAFLGLALLSGLLAMYRGLSRELLSIISWIVAAGAVFYFVLFHEKFAAEMAQQVGVPLKIAQIGIGALLFLIVLIVVHLVTARISDAIIDSRVGVIDRVFGFGFGVIRAFLIVLILYLFYAHFWPEDKQHDWVRRAASRDLFESAGATLRPVLQSAIERLTTRSGDQKQGSGPERFQNAFRTGAPGEEQQRASTELADQDVALSQTGAAGLYQRCAARRTVS